MAASNIQACTAAASLVDGLDLGLFPSSFKALESDLLLTPSSLGKVSMMAGLTTCLCVLAWGMVADNCNRKYVIVRVTATLGIITMATSRVDGFYSLAATRVSAGAIAAAMVPITQGLIAEVFPSSRRGAAYATLLFAGQLSAAGSASLLAVSNWRSAFMCMGALTMLLSIALAFMMEDIDQEHRSNIFPLLEARSGKGTTMKAEVEKVRYVFSIGTFWVILLGGIVGSIPWNALQFLMMYFQVVGFSPAAAASILSIGAFGRAFGSLFGGYFGDALALRFPRHGRACVAQLTIVLGMVALYILLRCCPPSPEYFKTFAAANFCFGLVSTWCGAAVDKPLWSEIVPANSRGTLVAWWTFIAGSFGSVFGAPIVGLLAENVYGYSFSSHGTITADGNARKAEALSSALMVCTLGPWALCCCFYSLIHITYPRELDALKTEDEPLKAGSEMRKP